MNQPLLTVIVPCYNVEKYVNKCISSIVGQTYSTLEILLIDDGSSDTTGTICDAWQERDARIRVIHKQNEGLAYARKTGVENASAEYVTFIDADDWIDPNMYTDMMSALLTTASDIALCDLCMVYDDKPKEYRVNKYTNSVKILDRIEGVLLVLEDSWRTSLSTKIYKKHLFDSVIFPKGRGYGEDLIISDLFHHASQSVLLDSVYYFYYQRSSSITNRGSISEELKKLCDFSDAHLERYMFVKQFPEYHKALPIVTYQATYLLLSLLRNMITYPQQFTDKYYKLKAEQLRSIPFYQVCGNWFRRGLKIELLVLMLSPRSYKLLRMFFVRIIRVTNRLKITNKRISNFLTDNDFWESTPKKLSLFFNIIYKLMIIVKKIVKRGYRLLIRLFTQSWFSIKILLWRHSTLSVDLLERVEPLSRKYGLDRGWGFKTRGWGFAVDRYYVEKFLYQNRQYVKGRILEIGEDVYATRYAHLNETASEQPIVETLHIDGTEKDVVIIGDLTKPETLPENRYDCFVCTQTFHVIYDVPKAFEGSYRLLKKGGVMLATVPGISQICRCDMDRWGDYWRFTNKSLELLFKATKFSHVEIVPMGNVMAACAFLQGMVVDELPKKELLDVMDRDYQLVIGIKAVK